MIASATQGEPESAQQSNTGLTGARGARRQAASRRGSVKGWIGGTLWAIVLSLTTSCGRPAKSMCATIGIVAFLTVAAAAAVSRGAVCDVALSVAMHGRSRLQSADRDRMTRQ